MVNKERCWYWLAAGTGPGGSAETRDPAALPGNREEHLRRNERSEWGPKWTQLCPAILRGRKGKQALVTDIAEPAKERELPVSLVLTWYEGLLVLDSIRRSGLQIPWFTEELRAQLKEAGVISPATYMSQQLHDQAVTGPEFLTSDGKTSEYRRKIVPKQDPAEGETKDGWYKVKSLAGYLPPWEAFIHPKCGIYQDFYMVQWDSPDDQTDYRDTEFGGDAVGTTWEPDECLPDELDNLRLRQKSSWLGQQRSKEAHAEPAGQADSKRRSEGAPEAAKAAKVHRTEEPAASAGRKQDPEGAPGTGGPAASAERRQHPEGAPRVSRAPGGEDAAGRATPASGPARGGPGTWLADLMGKAAHDPDPKLTVNDPEANIRIGWPVKEADYPPGHGAATPPGCCERSCTCMEDWHIGVSNIGAPRPWAGDHGRTQQAQQALETFARRADIVARRGLVSGRSFLEAIKVSAPSARHAEANTAVDFLNLATLCLKESAKAVPLQSLRAPPHGSGMGKGVFRHFSIAFNLREPVQMQDGGRSHRWTTGPYMPMTFALGTAPKWIQVSRQTGDVAVVESKLPEFDPGQGQMIQVGVVLSNFRSEDATMNCMVDVLRPENYGDNTLLTWTQQLSQQLDAVRPPTLVTLLRETMGPVYDFTESKPREGITFGLWVEVVSKAAALARAFSVAHALPWTSG